jgi:hypothetical protein
MPPKSTKTKSAKSIATPGTTRAAKAANVGKEKATIRKPKPVPRVGASTRRTVLTPSPVPETLSRPVSESPLGGELLDDHATFMDEIERTVQEVLAAREDKALSTAALPNQPFTAGFTGDIPPTLVGPPFAQHVLSRWPWVTEDIVKNIALGKFEIDTLPKLHRSDELRNSYLKRSMKGIYQPLDGGPPEIVVRTSKLQSSFREPTTFFLAWLIYISIRAELKPEMGSRLASWTERLYYFVKLNYPWPSILEYIIAYFQVYQNRTDTDAWFTGLDINGVLSHTRSTNSSLCFRKLVRDVGTSTRSTTQTKVG